MVRWTLVSVGLIVLFQRIDASPGKSRLLRFAHSSINLTFYRNFSHTDKEYKVSLIRGINKTGIVCKGSFNETLIPFEHNNCTVVPAANRVTFHLWGLNENSTDIYFFRKEEMYPPPYHSEEDEGTVIQKEYPVCRAAEVPKTFPLSLWVALGGCGLYGLIITAAFIYILRKGRRLRIQQSEYINVVPRQPKTQKPYVPYAMTPATSRTR